MMRRRLYAALISGFLLAGCTEHSEEQIIPASSSAAVTGSGPAGSAQSAVPNPTQLAAGKRHYTLHCAGCHGPEAQGEFGPALSGSKVSTLAYFEQAVREGQTAEGELLSSMPRFTPDLLPDQALSELHLYLQSLD